MKKNYFLILLMGIALFIGCSADNDPIDDSQNWIIIDVDGEDNGPDEEEEQETATSTTTELVAGQHTYAGFVTVNELDGGGIEVVYETNGDWVILETHLYVGTQEDMPANNPGNPRIGHFPYQDVHDSVTNVTYSDPNNFDITNHDDGTCSSITFVAAHAVVYNTVTNEEETAWANGVDIDGNSWAMYFSKCDN